MATPTYQRVATSEDAEPPAREGRGRLLSFRFVIVCLLGLLAAFYMYLSVRSATTAPQAGKRELSLLGRYEKHKLVTENAALKEKLETLQAQLKQREDRAMERAAQAAARPAVEQGGDGGPGMRETIAAGLGAAAAAAATPAGGARPSGAAAAAGAVNASAANYRLTKELIRSRCNAHNIILVTFVNAKRADYGYTWAAHVKRLGLSNYLVGAMDGAALQKLIARSIPTFDMESGLTTADYGWGTKNFRQLGLRKTELIINLLRAGADPIVTDADALVTRDPTPFVLRLQPEAQILVTSDHLMSTVGSDADVLETPERAVASAWNIGYFYIRHDVLPAMLHWQAECAAHPNLWDQNLFKDVLKIGGLSFSDKQRPAIKQKRLFLGYNRSVAIGILPISSFCSGHTYFVQRMPQRRGIQPYSVHTTFQYSGAVGKTHRLREAHLWEDPPEYYTAPAGFIAYTPVIRRELIKPAKQMDVASHFTLVHHQLVQMRAAFLLAARLKRILILPTLVCGLDRFWAPHNGTIPGSDTTLPIDPCPADHVLDLEHLERAAKVPVEQLLRESTFMENPRLPPSIKASVLKLPPPQDLGDASLAALKDNGMRVLHFESMPDLYASLSPLEADVAQKRMRTWTSIWCCSQPLAPKSPGHIFYDFFWDVVPHTTQHNKVMTEPWVPAFGP